MKVFIERSGKTHSLQYEGTAGKLLLKLDVNPEEVIITKNNEIITIDEPVKTGDRIKVLSVISGG